MAELQPIKSQKDIEKRWGRCSKPEGTTWQELFNQLKTSERQLLKSHQYTAKTIKLTYGIYGRYQRGLVTCQDGSLWALVAYDEKSTRKCILKPIFTDRNTDKPMIRQIDTQEQVAAAREVDGVIRVVTKRPCGRNITLTVYPDKKTYDVGDYLACKVFAGEGKGWVVHIDRDKIGLIDLATLKWEMEKTNTESVASSLHGRVENGQLIIAFSRNDTVKLVKVTAEAEFGRPTEIEVGTFVQSVRLFQAKGEKRLAVGTADGVVRIYNRSKDEGEEIQKINIGISPLRLTPVWFKKNLGLFIRDTKTGGNYWNLKDNKINTLDKADPLIVPGAGGPRSPDELHEDFYGMLRLIPWKGYLHLVRHEHNQVTLFTPNCVPKEGVLEKIKSAVKG